MRRHAYCGRKRTGKVKDAETRDTGKIGDGNIIRKMVFDIVENTLQASTRADQPKSDDDFSGVYGGYCCLCACIGLVLAIRSWRGQSAGVVRWRDKPTVKLDFCRRAPLGQDGGYCFAQKRYVDPIRRNRKLAPEAQVSGR